MPGPRKAVDDEPETIRTWLAELPNVTPVTGPIPSLGRAWNDAPSSIEATIAVTSCAADGLATATIVAGLPGARAPARSRHGSIEAPGSSTGIVAVVQVEPPSAEC